MCVCSASLLQIGEAVDTQALEGLARYEVHLDRKLERTLTMLLKLQSLRSDKRNGAPALEATNG